MINGMKMVAPLKRVYAFERIPIKSIPLASEPMEGDISLQKERWKHRLALPNQ